MLKAKIEGITIDSIVDFFLNPPVSKMQKECKILEKVSDDEFV